MKTAAVLRACLAACLATTAAAQQAPAVAENNNNLLRGGLAAQTAPAVPTPPAVPAANATAPKPPATPAAPAAPVAPAAPAVPATPAVPVPPPAPQAEEKKGPSGLKLKMLINCFAWYLPDAAYRADNSKVQGCDESTIVFCKTDSGNGDHMCKFDGSNNLQDAWDANPECYFNCQMESCNSWGSPATDAQRKCVGDLWN